MEDTQQLGRAANMRPIERVSRIIEVAITDASSGRADTVASAQAILLALREPSEKMVKAGSKAGIYAPLNESTAAAWQAMIDAALAEQ